MGGRAWAVRRCGFEAARCVDCSARGGIHSSTTSSASVPGCRAILRVSASVISFRHRQESPGRVGQVVRCLVLVLLYGDEPAQHLLVSGGERFHGGGSLLKGLCHASSGWLLAWPDLCLHSSGPGNRSPGALPAVGLSGYLTMWQHGHPALGLPVCPALRACDYLTTRQHGHPALPVYGCLSTGGVISATLGRTSGRFPAFPGWGSPPAP